MLLNQSAAVYGNRAIAVISIASRFRMFIFSIAFGIDQGFPSVAGFIYGVKK